MTTWYFPSWNGDVRIETHPDDQEKTLVTIIEPTNDELRVLKALAVLFGEKGWMNKRKTIWNPRGNKDRQETTIHAPLLDIGLYMIGHLKPGIATLTAVKLEDGSVTAKATAEKGFMAWLNSFLGKAKGDEKIAGVGELAELLESAASLPEQANLSPHQREAPEPKKEEETKPAKTEKAATVKRPTPSCPKCMPGAIEPANEVLQSFLTEEQHELWAKDRAIVVRGGITGHRYLVSHRHGRHAIKAGKICFDLDDLGVLHFHDNSVPPEEEVLATKLILEHREPWLRHEATCLGGDFDFVFKNPFGGGGDGVPDSQLTGEVGNFLRGFLMTFGGGKLALPEDKPFVPLANKAASKAVKDLGLV